MYREGIVTPIDIFSILYSSLDRREALIPLMTKSNTSYGRLNSFLKKAENNGLIYRENSGQTFFKMSSKGCSAYGGIIGFISQYDLQSLLNCEVSPSLSPPRISYSDKLKHGLPDTIFNPHPEGIFGIRSLQRRSRKRSHLEEYMDILAVTSTNGSSINPIINLSHNNRSTALKLIEIADKKDHIKKLDRKRYQRTKVGTECIIDWAYLLWKFFEGLATTYSIPRLETLRYYARNIKTLTDILDSPTNY